MEELVVKGIRAFGWLVEDVQAHNLSLVLSSEVLVELKGSDLAVGLSICHDGVLHSLDGILVLGVVLDVNDSGVEWAEEVSGDLGLLVVGDVNALLLEGLGDLGGGGDVLGKVIQVEIVSFLGGHFLFFVWLSESFLFLFF